MRGLIGSDGADLDTEFCVGCTSVDERGPDDGHGVVSSVDNEHTDQLLDTVDDEVSSQLFSLFSLVDQFLRRKTLEVAAVGL